MPASSRLKEGIGGGKKKIVSLRMQIHRMDGLEKPVNSVWKPAGDPNYSCVGKSVLKVLKEDSKGVSTATINSGKGGKRGEKSGRTKDRIMR